MSAHRLNPNDARYEAQRQQEAIRGARERQERERQNHAQEMQRQQHRPNLAAAAAAIPAPLHQPGVTHNIATSMNGEHHAPESAFSPELPVIPLAQQIMPPRHLPINPRIRSLNSAAGRNGPRDPQQWQSLFPPAESAAPSPPAATVHSSQGQPARFWDGRPTLHGLRWLIQTTTRDAQVPDSRFPLLISQGSQDREFIAPLPWVTEEDRQQQQAVVDPDLIAPFYRVRDPDQDRFVPRSTEPEHMRRGRIELGRYGDVPFHNFAPNPAYPPHTPDNRQLPLQPWMPPYNMPRHPVMAYWGHDLTERIDNPPVVRLPQMLLWTSHQDPNTRGTFLPRPMFERTTNDHTDRGWGPGVQVHPSLRPSLARAVEHMQTQVLTHQAQMFRTEERMLNEAASVVQELSPVVYSPASEDVPMDDVSAVSEEDNDDERDLDWQEDEEEL